ncbi:MAG: trans-aconitate 2-methyltransferase [Granulosicoccus sp.]
MKPSDIGEAYDQITDLWVNDSFDRKNGIAQHKKAMSFVKNRGRALDVGCGCTGRLIDLLLVSGFDPEGVDVSGKMITLAKERHPDVVFYQQDVCVWDMPHTYDFITAWDSIWHIPIDQHEKLLTRLISRLNRNGVLIFSFGGTDEKDEHNDSSMGPELYYSTMGVSGFLKLFLELDCTCRHLEYDQYPQPHTYLIVQKS